MTRGANCGSVEIARTERRFHAVNAAPFASKRAVRARDRAPRRCVKTAILRSRDEILEKTDAQLNDALRERDMGNRRVPLHCRREFFEPLAADAGVLGGMIGSTRCVC
jgi:hypothetical protein